MFDFAVWRQKRRQDPIYRRHELDRDNAARRRALKINPKYAKKVRARDRQVYRSRSENWLKRARIRKYKITPVEWDALFAFQGSVCAICKNSSPGNKHGTWQTDHDHITEKVRGILCTHCNVMVGMARDNPNYLIEGAKYLGER